MIPRLLLKFPSSEVDSPCFVISGYSVGDKGELSSPFDDIGVFVLTVVGLEDLVAGTSVSVAVFEGVDV